MRWAALFLLIAVGASPAGAQPVVTSAGPERVAVTVYRDPSRNPTRGMNLGFLNGFAMVSERRRVRLPAGESIIRFEGVAAGIVPQSAIVSGFPDGIVERNRDAYLLSPATLLDRSLGERVHLRRTSTATGEVREEEAIVRSSADGAIVVETAAGIESLRCTGLPETLTYDGIPGGLSARPTLSVRTRAAAAVEAEVTLSYLATGFDWQANYVAQLSADGRRVDLFAWLTLASTDETSFVDADTQAVAGTINYTRAAVPPAEGGPLRLQCWPSARTSDVPLQQGAIDAGGPVPLLAPAAPAEEVIVTGSRISNALRRTSAVIATQEALGDLKLYRIPIPVTVAANAQKQVALLVQPRVQVEMVYRTRVQMGQATESRPATRTLVTRNRIAEGLGLPLPAGGVALFAEHRGRPLLVGQGSLDDRAVGDDVEIRLDASPSVFFVTRVEGQATLLTVTNDQDRPVAFEAEFERADGARFVSARRLAERDGRPLWRGTVPANGTATLRYSYVPQPL